MDASFPLLHLIPSLREKVINKVDPKSYFRLFRTCRCVNEFIHKNKNISIHVDNPSNYLLMYSSRIGYHFSFGGEHEPSKDVSLNRFFGVRMGEISISSVNKGGGIREICDLLRENRITLPWTASYFEEFLNIVKPIFINCDESGDYQYQGILKAKTVKSVSLFMKLNDAYNAIPDLLATMEKLEIRTGIETNKHFNLTRKILKMVLDKPFPKLNEFEFVVSWDVQLTPSKEDVAKQLDGFNFAIEQDDEKRDTMVVVKTPDHFPQGSSCEVVIEDRPSEPCTYDFAEPGEMFAEYTSLRIHYLRGDVPAIYPHFIEE